MSYYSAEGRELLEGRIPVKLLGDSGEVFYELALEMVSIIEENKAKIAEMRAAGNIHEEVYVAPDPDCGCDAGPEPEAEDPQPETPIVVEPLAEDKKD